VVSFTPQPLYPREKNRPVPIGQDAGWVPEPVWTLWSGKKCQTLSQNVVPSVPFSTGKQIEITGGYVQRVGRLGNDYHVVVSHKLCGFQGSVGGRVVVMKEPVVITPEFRASSSITDPNDLRAHGSFGDGLRG
jgi:hypothetical protein